MRTRFAPSPTGYLHLGHIVAAKEAFGFGPCLLRIEDIDHTRCKAKYTTAIYQDLHWLGFDWPLPVRVQSQHLEAYKAVIEALRARGLLYRCFKTRAQLAQTPPAPLSSQQEKTLLSANTPFAWRLSIEKCRPLISAPLRYMETDQYKTVNIEALSDIVLARKDIGMSYHIAVTHDDMAQNITHVVRGADFIDQTPYHILIQQLMGWPSPAYHHHALLLRDDGEKLSKRNLDTSIKSLRENSLTVAQVLDMASL